MKLLCKPIALFVPLLAFLTLGQLHENYMQPIAAIYIMLSSIYCLIRPNKLPQGSMIKNCQNAFKVGSVLTLAFVILVWTWPIGGYMSVPLMVPHSQEKADAIVVLASGATRAGDPGYAGYQRVIHGIELLKKGQAKHLYISTGYSEVYGFLEYNWVASLTQLMELPSEQVTIAKSDEIITTATEAAYAKNILNSMGMNKILLTTSNAHIYRSIKTFEKAGFEVLAAPSHDARTVIFGNPYMIQFHAAMHEWVGLAWYWLRGRI